MKHQKKGRKFNRKTGQRKALLKSLVHNLVVNEKIKTTEAKAKELRPVIEKMITKAKNDTVANRRTISQKIINKRDVKKIFERIAPKYKERNGGYTRIIKTPVRKRDAAKMAMIEFI